MYKAALTYGLLDERLRALGFTVRTRKGEARIYRHGPSGAGVILPDAPFDQEVPSHHLIVVRRMLTEYDLADVENGQIVPLGK